MLNNFILTIFLLSFFNNINSEEINHIFCIDDREPYHISWNKDKSGDWIHNLHFKRAIVNTYFKNDPINQGDSRFNVNKPPYKQTIEFVGCNRFCTEDFSIEILENNRLCFCFVYNIEFDRGEEKYKSVVVSLMHGLDPKDDFYEYSLIPGYKGIK